VRVEGHSDDQPIHSALYRSNWELSTARAMSVLSAFVDEAGFPAQNISLAGYGPYRPIADNATAAGRRLNRRVNLVVIAPTH
jgi:chemotaxis protein MotB